MDRLIYTAMHGAKQIMQQQTVNANNLANLDTAGFRADLDAFKSLPVYGPGHASRVYSLDYRAGIDFHSGRILHTGRDLDVAINGTGLIAVQAPDGREAYTRAGDFHVNNAGLLHTGAGHPVMGNGGPIAIPPFERLEIGADGTISILPLGQEAANLAIIDRIKLVKPDEAFLQKDMHGLLSLRNGESPLPDATVKLMNGSLETSNVNAVDAMINMIQLARNFEAQIKVMKAAEESDAATTRLMGVS